MKLRITSSTPPRKSTGGENQIYGICVIDCSCASTITTRYGAMTTTNLIGSGHFQMTAILIEYEYQE